MYRGGSNVCIGEVVGRVGGGSRVCKGGSNVCRGR